MKAGILIDTWKLPIFEKHLKKENIPYTPVGEFSPGVTSWIVETEEPERLRTVLKAANAEAALKGPPK